ncbi:MAG: aminotransferase class I/II-fold pyridoxal phosphate-dependent enzyme [Promethearchaeota archaeon]|nr:MAG: aminotransferase class I/II-fold pyridoxal phosphate-dependent enzyme [Candidatus Lokiarchaeota archaeon]
MKELSQKVAQAPKSKIRELFDLAAGRENVISLGIGQPDFDTPQPAIQGNIDALKKNITHYAPTRGIPALLEEIERKAKRFNHISLEWEKNIIVTNGGSQALSLAFASLFNPGDELILFSPNFISYFYLAVFFGVKIVEIERKSDFSLDLNAVKQKVTPKTKAILINSPNNPTGYVMNQNELHELVDIIIKNDLYLLSDEVYENYTYNKSKHISPASIKEMFERTITLNAMSKLFSATGFRLGYAIAKKEIIDLMENYHQYTVAGTNHPAQFGFLEALKMDSSFFHDILESFDRRRQFTFKRLIEIGFDVIKPKGAFYIMPSVRPFNVDGNTFSQNLMKNSAVAVVPGDIFGSYSNEMIRISYATEYGKLEEAMDRIEKYVKIL